MLNALQRTLISYLFENVCNSEIEHLFDSVIYYGTNEPLLIECRNFYSLRESDIARVFDRIEQLSNEEIVQWVRSNLLCCNVRVMFTMAMRIIQSERWNSVTSDILIVLLDDLALF